MWPQTTLVRAAFTTFLAFKDLRRANTLVSLVNMSTAASVSEPATEAKKFQDVSESYATLLGKLNTICQLQRCKSILGYDQMVFMPKNPETSSERGAQLSALAGLIHEKSTENDILQLIQKSEEDLAALSDSSSYADESRLLEIEKKAFLEDKRVPAALAAKRAALSAAALQIL